MLKDYALIGSVLINLCAAILTVLAFVDPNVRNKLARLLKSRYKWSDVPSKITHARHRVWILQTWFPVLRRERKFWEEALRRDDIDFRVLVIDEAFVPNRLVCRTDVSNSSLPENLVIFKEIFGKYPRRFKARSYSNLPFGPIYIIDDDVYWGLYLPQKDSLDVPANRTAASSEIGHLIVDGYECVWRKFEDKTLLVDTQGSPKQLS